MIDPREMEWLHADLDGELNAADQAALARALARSPDLRALRAELRELAAILERAAPVPAPPESLHQRILAMAWRRPVTEAQSSADENSPTFPIVRRIGFGRTGVRRSRHQPDFIHSQQQRNKSMSTMTTKKKALVTGLAIAIVVVAGGVAYFGNGLPSGNREMAAATIAPAHRYEASQVSSSDIQLGDQSVAKFVQTDTYQQIIHDPAIMTLLQSDAFRSAIASSEMRSALASPDALRSAIARTDAMRAALANSAAFRTALARNDAFRSALASNDAFRMALANNDAFRSA
ncbi:MAG: hypothetical protein ACREP2_10460, partial [Rhodanobacteraceae bacterium]